MESYILICQKIHAQQECIVIGTALMMIETYRVRHGHGNPRLILIALHTLGVFFLNMQKNEAPSPTPHWRSGGGMFSGD